MPLKPHPTDPDKMVYVSHQYDIPQLQGVITQRPWVGLTPKEVAEIVIYPMNQTADLVRAIEAKLKEKNEH